MSTTLRQTPDMKKNTRQEKRQKTQTQKMITPFTRSSLKMADSAVVNAQGETLEITLSLGMLREELQTSREEVLFQIKAEIATSFKEIKKDIVSLHEETKGNIRSIQDELSSEFAWLRSAQAETADNVTRWEPRSAKRWIGSPCWNRHMN